MNQSFLLNVLLFTLILLMGFATYYLIHIGNQHVGPSKRIHLQKDRILKVLLGIFLAIGFIVLVRNNPIIRSVLFAIVLAAVMAYILNPPVQRLERRGVKRTLAILIIYAMIVAVLAILFILVLPRTVRETTNFIRALPTLLTRGINSIVDFVDMQMGDYISINEMANRVNAALSEILVNLQEMIFNFAGSVSGYLGSLFTRFVGVFIFPIITFYFLQDKETFKQFLIEVIPSNRKEPVFALGRDIDRSLSQFVRGRLLMAVFVGVVTAIFLFIVRIDFAIVIGMITMIADIIPYIGPFLGFVPAVFLALMQGPFEAFRVAVFFVLIQWVENNIIGPKLLGDSTGLHPFVVLLCLVIGGSLFGFLGMIFAVPVVAVILIVIRHFQASQRKRNI